MARGCNPIPWVEGNDTVRNARGARSFAPAGFCIDGNEEDDAITRSAGRVNGPPLRRGSYSKMCKHGQSIVFTVHAPGVRLLLYSSRDTITSGADSPFNDCLIVSHEEDLGPCTLLSS